MTEELYEKITQPIRGMANGIKIINMIDKISAGIVYFTYPLILLILAINRDIRFWKVLIIPAVSFIVVSLFRKSANIKRPYEILCINPLIHKETRGKSFPSRHVFSAFVIAMNLYYISIPLGVFLMIIGTIVAVVRVVGGVHFPRDVIAGASIGVLCTVIGWKLIVL